MSDLSAETKEHLRKYVISLVLLPTGAMTIVGFIFGFFVNEVARGTAYTEAYREAQTAIMEMAAQASTSKSEAFAAAQEAKQTVNNVKLAQREAERASDTVKDIKLEAEEYLKHLETVIAIKQGLATKVAQSLLENPEILTNKVTGEYGARLNAVETSLSQFSSTILWGVNSSGKVYYSEDEGRSWRQPQIVGDDNKRRLKDIANSNGVLWGIGTGKDDNDKVFISYDNGQSWAEPNIGTRLTRISASP